MPAVYREPAAMKLRIGQRMFTPSLMATLLTLVLLPLLINLGLWQLRRADEKRALMAQAAVGQHQILTLTAANASQLSRYQHVQLQGAFDNAHQVLLDNMPSVRGEPGYRIWTSLKLADASIVLIDRGWVALGSNRQQLPRIQVDEQTRTVSGLLDELPRPGVRAGNAGVSTNWPQRLNYPHLDELRQLYGSTLQPRIVLMDATIADGFERAWQINRGFSPERHVGYAVQWFGLAATLLIIYLVVNLKRITDAHV